ncbi:hypothetical protein CSAL01_08618 [Colletotrichum salicis]|uniref:Uncharacterized protein n=1 Tax=Colletotrichum salicis TaxID=1209931 RepID=A0A135V3F7_9PEZI|nr:hypothetical protein CSAL01_08618 [Colletotrichum salicis]
MDGNSLGGRKHMAASSPKLLDQLPEQRMAYSGRRGQYPQMLRNASAYDDERGAGLRGSTEGSPAEGNTDGGRSTPGRPPAGPGSAVPMSKSLRCPGRPLGGGAPVSTCYTPIMTPIAVEVLRLALSTTQATAPSYTTVNPYRHVSPPATASQWRDCRTFQRARSPTGLTKPLAIDKLSDLDENKQHELDEAIQLATKGFTPSQRTYAVDTS